MLLALLNRDIFIMKLLYKTFFDISIFEIQEKKAKNHSTYKNHFFVSIISRFIFTICM